MCGANGEEAPREFGVGHDASVPHNAMGSVLRSIIQASRREAEGRPLSAVTF